MDSLFVNQAPPQVQAAPELRKAIAIGRHRDTAAPAQCKVGARPTSQPGKDGPSSLLSITSNHSQQRSSDSGVTSDQ